MLTTTDTNNEFDAAMHIGELSAKISQLQVTVTASDNRRDTREAETKQPSQSCGSNFVACKNGIYAKLHIFLTHM